MIAGLCGHCRHARVNQTRRGPSYLRCQLASVDESFPRYPRLPVLRCAGYQPAENPDQQDSDQQDSDQQDSHQQDSHQQDPDRPERDA